MNEPLSAGTLLDELKERILSAPGPFSTTTILSLLVARLRQEGIHITALREISGLDQLDGAQIEAALKVLPDVIGASLPDEVVLQQLLKRRRSSNQ